MNFIAIGLFSEHSHTERTDNNPCGRRGCRGLASAQVLSGKGALAQRNLLTPKWIAFKWSRVAQADFVYT